MLLRLKDNICRMYLKSVEVLACVIDWSVVKLLNIHAQVL